MVNKTFSIELQGNINFTGVKGKIGLKNFILIDVILSKISNKTTHIIVFLITFFLFFSILEIICESVPELFTMYDENEKYGKAEAELKYQLQHFYDRKRSFDRKNKIDKPEVNK